MLPKTKKAEPRYRRSAQSKGVYPVCLIRYSQFSPFMTGPTVLIMDLRAASSAGAQAVEYVTVEACACKAYDTIHCKSRHSSFKSQTFVHSIQTFVHEKTEQNPILVCSVCLLIALNFRGCHS